MGTKNNPKNREKGGKKIIYNGKEVVPIKFYGSNRGLPNLIAAVYTGTSNVIFDKGGKPLSWHDVKNAAATQS
jgi:hypothetical protein